MKKNFTIHCVLLLSSVFVLEACAGLRSHKEVKLPVSQRFPIEVADTELKLILKSDSAAGSLTPAQITQLDAFAATYFVRGKGAVMVEYTEASSDASLMVAALREHLHETGIDWQMISISPTSGDSANRSADIKLSFATHSARSSACDKKSNGSFLNASRWHNATSPNFGCATQNNIAAMISDPSELERPAALQPADSERRIDTLGKYRRGDVTAQSSDPLVSQTSTRETE